MSLIEYQENIRELLQNSFHLETVSEWNTTMDLGLYSPRLDIGVGPFATQNEVSLVAEYNQIFEENIDLIRRFTVIHLINVNRITNETPPEERQTILNHKLDELRYFNFNSRCFLAVEIENEVSRKHLMGGALNASALGRIAIAVGYTDEKHIAFLRLYKYFQFLQNVDKPTFKTNNILVISKDQLQQILQGNL